MKHVGKMKNNAARVAVVYRTLPGDPNSALVVGTNGLPDSYHDSLMSLIQAIEGQQANELAEILAVRKFPDGTNMLEFLHTRGHLKKVPTNLVLMTPNTQTTLQLDELNKNIAEQRKVSIENLAINDGSSKKDSLKKSQKTIEPIVEENVQKPLNAAEMRSRADALYKEAATLRKIADELDPPKKKTSRKKETETINVE
jgi:hypothetical protein